LPPAGNPSVRLSPREALHRALGEVVVPPFVVNSELEEELAGVLRLAGVPKPARQFRFAPPRRWRADFAWPTAHLLLEVDGATWTGGRHTTGSGIESDAEKQSTAAAVGYRTMRVTKAMVRDGRALLLIEQALAWRPATIP